MQWQYHFAVRREKWDGAESFFFAIQRLNVAVNCYINMMVILVCSEVCVIQLQARHKSHTQKGEMSGSTQCKVTR